jgi:hypothetical protein
LNYLPWQTCILHDKKLKNQICKLHIAWATRKENWVGSAVGQCVLTDTEVNWNSWETACGVTRWDWCGIHILPPHSCLALARTSWRIPTLKPHSPSRHSLTQRAYPDTIHSLAFPLELRTCLVAWAYIVSLPVAWTYNNMILVQGQSTWAPTGLCFRLSFWRPLAWSEGLCVCVHVPQVAAPHSFWTPQHKRAHFFTTSQTHTSTETTFKWETNYHPFSD